MTPHTDPPPQIPYGPVHPFPPPVIEPALVRAPYSSQDRRRALVAWVVVLLCVGAVYAMQRMAKSAPPQPRTGPSAQQLMVLRGQVGGATLTRQLSPDAGNDAVRAQIALQIRQAVKTDSDRLYAAVATVALGQDPAAASLLLDQIEPADEDVRRDVRVVRKLIGGGTAALDEEDRRRLIDRHKWVGELATVADLPEDDPARQAVLAPAKRTSIVSMSMLGLVALVLISGIVLLVIGIALAAAGSLRMAAVPPPADHVALLEAFAVFSVLFTTGMLLGAADNIVLALVALGLAVAAPVMAILWPIRRGMRWGEVRQAIGLTSGRNVIIESLCGVVGYIALFPITAAGIAIALFLTSRFGADTSHPLTEMFEPTPVRIILLFLLAAVWAPVSEELVFRGAFFGHLRTRISWLPAALITGVIFAAIHPQGWAGIPALGAIGMNLAIIRHWRGSLVAPVVAHALNNGAILTLLVLAVA